MVVVYSQVHRYHESVSDWNFGKLSALREVALAIEGSYDWYYMGECIFWVVLIVSAYNSDI